MLHTRVEPPQYPIAFTGGIKYQLEHDIVPFFLPEFADLPQVVEHRYFRIVPGGGKLLFRQYDPALDLTALHAFAPDGWVPYGWGAVEIKAGYAWDGPSGPALDTDSFYRASLLHDVLYQAMRLELLAREWRRKVDGLMRRVARWDGMLKLRRMWTWFGVRIGASKAADPKSVRKVRYAPKEWDPRGMAGD